MAELSGQFIEKLPPRPMTMDDLKAYQKPMASEAGPRQMNALQREFRRHPDQGIQ